MRRQLPHGYVVVHADLIERPFPPRRVERQRYGPDQYQYPRDDQSRVVDHEEQHRLQRSGDVEVLPAEEVVDGVANRDALSRDALQARDRRLDHPRVELVSVVVQHLLRDAHLHRRFAQAELVNHQVLVALRDFLLLRLGYRVIVPLIVAHGFDVLPRERHAARDGPGVAAIRQRHVQLAALLHLARRRVDGSHVHYLEVPLVALQRGYRNFDLPQKFRSVPDPGERRDDHRDVKVDDGEDRAEVVPGVVRVLDRGQPGPVRSVLDDDEDVFDPVVELVQLEDVHLEPAEVGFVADPHLL